MEYLSFYRNINDYTCNIKDDCDPLIVNCAGFHNLNYPREVYSDSGRSDYYLQYVTKGQLNIWLDGETKEFSEGMFIIHLPNAPYHFSSSGKDETQYYWVHFTGFYVQRLMSNLHINNNYIYCTDLQRKDLVLDIFNRIFKELSNRRIGFTDSCAAFLSELFIELARSIDIVCSGPLRKLVSLAYLHSHYQENTPIGDLAAMECLSESRYREIFRNHTGYSPSDYRTALRMQHACYLLSTTDITMAEISVACGYTEVFYFLRVFKTKIGMTPGEYRTLHRQ